MTDGTSQGLFIVVAIVIFGIFIALSHTVFGSTLSDGVENIFSTSMNSTLSIFVDGEIIHSKNRVELSSIGNELGDYDMGNYTIDGENFEQDGVYTLSYKIEVVEGELASLRGHLHSSTNPKFYVNDELLIRESSASWGRYASGYLFDEPFGVGETIDVVVRFTADRYDDPISHTNPAVSISPNNYMNSGRQRHEVESRVIVRDIQLIKHN